MILPLRYKYARGHRRAIRRAKPAPAPGYRLRLRDGRGTHQLIDGQGRRVWVSDDTDDYEWVRVQLPRADRPRLRRSKWRGTRPVLGQPDPLF